MDKIGGEFINFDSVYMEVKMKEISSMTLSEMRNEIKQYVERMDKENGYAFISYSHMDCEVVYRKVLGWMRAGYNIYLDVDFENRSSDDNWVDIMEEYVQNVNCKVAVCFRSAHYFCSYAALLELLTIRGKETRQNRDDLLKIEIVQCDKDSYKTMLETAEMKDNYGNKYKKYVLDMNNEFLSHNKGEAEVLKKGIKYFYSKNKDADFFQNKEFEDWEEIIEWIKKGFKQGPSQFFQNLGELVMNWFIVYGLTGNYKEDISNDQLDKYGIKSNTAKSIIQEQALKDEESIKEEPIKEEQTKTYKELVEIEPSLKIGKLVQKVLKPLIIEKATATEIELMQTVEYSKENFGIQYPLLLKTKAEIAERHYYKELFAINGETYRLCCEWFETDANNDRPFVEKWIKKYEKGEGKASPRRAVNVKENGEREIPVIEKYDVKITREMTLKQFAELFNDDEFVLYIRTLRGKDKKRYSRQIVDYLMVAILRGCDSKVEPFSAPWKYCTYAVASKLDLDNPTLGASQFTWQSNSRKAIGIEGSGKLGECSELFSKLDENMTLGELQQKFADSKEKPFQTKNNVMVENVFNALYMEM